MFFPKLRAHAKWVFVLLAIVFAGGFVFLGVGSGSSGLGDLLSGNFSNVFGGNPTNSAVTKAEDAVKKNPKDVQANKDLATALQTNNQFDRAIIVLEQVRKAAPKDTDALTQLAGLYLRKADLARNQAQAIQAEQSVASSSQIFDVASTSKLGQAFQGSADPLTGVDPINRGIQSLVNTRAGAAYTAMGSSYKKAMDVYKQIAALSPTDPSVQFQLAQAGEAAGDTATTIAAYEAFLKLAPDDPTAPAVRARLKQLQAPQAQPSATTGG
jgi:cytochrome c-type biogenesis protein CcmH/NrfG